MLDLRQKIDETKAAIKKKVTLRPSIGIILGTGLGELVKEIRGKSPSLTTTSPISPFLQSIATRVSSFSAGSGKRMSSRCKVAFISMKAIP